MSCEFVDQPHPLVELLGRGRVTVPEIFRARVNATPGGAFLRWEERTWTYAAALEEVERFASWALRQPTDGSRLRIVSFLGNRPETVWVWLGSMVAGAVYVPLNRAQRGEVLHDMLVRAAASVVVTDEEGAALLAPLANTSVQVVLVVEAGRPGRTEDGVARVGWNEVAASEPQCGPAQGATPDDVAQILYTSGSTGRSKAVLLTHNQMCRGAGWIAQSIDMTTEDVFHVWVPLFHVAGQVDIALSSIVSGAEIALHSGFSRSRFWDEIAAGRCTIFAGFSNVMELLWSLPVRPDDADCTLRAGLIGAIPQALQRPFEARFGLALYDTYGMTEAEPLALPDRRAPVGSCGRPSPDFDIRVLGDTDEPMPVGEVGEICFRPRRRSVMFAGYEGDPAATLAAVCSLWFHTGDLGRFDDDGYLYFVDRKKHRIRRRGENVSSWELEQLLLKHPAVEECAAVGVPSPLGEEDVKVVVVAGSDIDLDPRGLHRWCEERMARFMVPRYVEVVDALPRMPTGKVRKEGLQGVSPGTWDAELDGARS